MAPSRIAHTALGTLLGQEIGASSWITVDQQRIDEFAHCRERMAGYKVPRSVRFVEALPKSTVGKMLRRELRNLD